MSKKFSTLAGLIIPETVSLEHWRFALGIPYQAADGSLVEPDLPVLRWLFNLKYFIYLPEFNANL